MQGPRFRGLGYTGQPNNGVHNVVESCVVLAGKDIPRLSYKRGQVVKDGKAPTVQRTASIARVAIYVMFPERVNGQICLVRENFEGTAVCKDV